MVITIWKELGVKRELLDALNVQEWASATLVVQLALLQLSDARTHQKVINRALHH